MKFQIITAEQRSLEWRQARAGRLTGSRAEVIFMSGRKKGEESKTRRDYRLQLVAERISGVAQENLIFTADMQRGIELEPVAFAMYEASTGEVVRRTGFLKADDSMTGCSVDGDVNEFSGIVELKCPKLATHLCYLADPATLRADYFAQVQHNLWISGAAYCDLVSFDDRLPGRKQLVRVRVERGDASIGDYERAALAFLNEVDDVYRHIMEAGNE